MFYSEPMPIPSVTSLVVDCWLEAENKLRGLLKKKYWSKGEEFITELFHGELREIVDKAAKDKKVEVAFLEDLRSQFPELEYSGYFGYGYLEQIADGIEASTTLHPRQVEAKTGGDLGILLIRPSVSKSFEGRTLIVEHEYCRGLLCQAKLKKKSKQRQSDTWGRLTPNQKRILPDKTDYLSLLLYEYIDSENHELSDFHWQLCKDAEIKEIEAWLKAGDFPNKVSSSDIIESLSDAKIGTDKSDLINSDIRPKTNKSLEIRIGWSPSKKPPGDIPILENIFTQTNTTEKFELEI